MAEKKHIPERTCVGCFKKFKQSDLLALTRLKSGKLVLNTDHKKSGRSVYLCRNKLCLNKALKRKGKNALQYGLQVQIPEEVLESLKKILEESERAAVPTHVKK